MRANVAGWEAGFARAASVSTGFANRVMTPLVGVAQMFRTVGVVMFGVGAAGAFAFSKMIGPAIEFQDQMAQVATMVDDTGRHMDDFAEGVTELSARFGEATASLAKGLYDILSAAIAPSEALSVLEVSARAAAAGMTDTGTAADAVTTMLNAFSLSADQAEDVADLLFAIVRRGKTTFDALAPSIGRVAASTALAGMSMEEMGATLATVTRAGIPTRIAMTSLNAVIRNFLTPTDEARAAAAQLGIELNTTTLRTMGLSGVIVKLAGLQPELVGKMFPNVRALRAMAAVLQGATGYAYDYQVMLNRTGMMSEAFEKRTLTLQFAINQLKETGLALVRMIGTALLPDLTELAKKVVAVGKAFLSLDESTKLALARFAAVAPVILILVGALGLLWGPLTSLAVFTTATLIPAMLAFTTALMVTPFGLVVAIGAVIAAVVGGISIFKKLRSIVDVVKNAVSDLTEELTGGKTSTVDLGDSVLTLVEKYKALLEETKSLGSGTVEFEEAKEDLMDVARRLGPEIVILTDDFINEKKSIDEVTEALKEQTRVMMLRIAYEETGQRISELTERLSGLRSTLDRVQTMEVMEHGFWRDFQTDIIDTLKNFDWFGLRYLGLREEMVETERITAEEKEKFLAASEKTVAALEEEIEALKVRRLEIAEALAVEKEAAVKRAEFERAEIAFETAITEWLKTSTQKKKEALDIELARFKEQNVQYKDITLQGVKYRVTLEEWYQAQLTEINRDEVEKRAEYEEVLLGRASSVRLRILQDEYDSLLRFGDATKARREELSEDILKINQEEVERLIEGFIAVGGEEEELTLCMMAYWERYTDYVELSGIELTAFIKRQQDKTLEIIQEGIAEREKEEEEDRLRDFRAEKTTLQEIHTIQVDAMKDWIAETGASEKLLTELETKHLKEMKELYEKYEESVSDIDSDLSQKRRDIQRLTYDEYLKIINEFHDWEVAYLERRVLENKASQADIYQENIRWYDAQLELAKIYNKDEHDLTLQRHAEQSKLLEWQIKDVKEKTQERYDAEIKAAQELEDNIIENLKDREAAESEQLQAEIRGLHHRILIRRQYGEETHDLDMQLRQKRRDLDAALTKEFGDNIEKRYEAEVKSNADREKLAINNLQNIGATEAQILRVQIGYAGERYNIALRYNKDWVDLFTARDALQRTLLKALTAEIEKQVEERTKAIQKQFELEVKYATEAQDWLISTLKDQGAAQAEITQAEIIGIQKLFAIRQRYGKETHDLDMKLTAARRKLNTELTKTYEDNLEKRYEAEVQYVQRAEVLLINHLLDIKATDAERFQVELATLGSLIDIAERYEKDSFDLRDQYADKARALREEVADETEKLRKKTYDATVLDAERRWKEDKRTLERAEVTQETLLLAEIKYWQDRVSIALRFGEDIFAANESLQDAIDELNEERTEAIKVEEEKRYKAAVQAIADTYALTREYLAETEANRVAELRAEIGMLNQKIAAYALYGKRTFDLERDRNARQLELNEEIEKDYEEAQKDRFEAAEEASREREAEVINRLRNIKATELQILQAELGFINERIAILSWFYKDTAQLERDRDAKLRAIEKEQTESFKKAQKDRYDAAVETSKDLEITELNRLKNIKATQAEILQAELTFANQRFLIALQFNEGVVQAEVDRDAKIRALEKEITKTTKEEAYEKLAILEANINTDITNEQARLAAMVTLMHLRVVAAKRFYGEESEEYARALAQMAQATRDFDDYVTSLAQKRTELVQKIYEEALDERIQRLRASLPVVLDVQNAELVTLETLLELYSALADKEEELTKVSLKRGDTNVQIIAQLKDLWVSYYVLLGFTAEEAAELVEQRWKELAEKHGLITESIAEAWARLMVEMKREAFDWHNFFKNLLDSLLDALTDWIRGALTGWREYNEERALIEKEYAEERLELEEKYAEDLADLEKERLDDIEDFQKRVTDITEDYLEKRVKLEKAYYGRLADLEKRRLKEIQKYDKRVADLEKKKNKDLEKARERYEKEVADARGDLLEEEEDYREDIEDLEEKHLEKLEKLRKDFYYDSRDALDEMFDWRKIRLLGEEDLYDEINKLIYQLEHEFLGDLDEEETRLHDDRLARLYEIRDETFAAIGEEADAYTEAYEDRRREHEKTVEELLRAIAEYETEYVTTVNVINTEFAEVMRELREAHDETIQDIIEAIAKLTRDYLDRLKEIEDDFKERMDELERRHKEAMAKLEEEIRELREEYEKQIAELTKAFQDQIAELEKQLNVAATAWDTFKDAILGAIAEIIATKLISWLLEVIGLTETLGVVGGGLLAVIIDLIYYFGLLVLVVGTMAWQIENIWIPAFVWLIEVIGWVIEKVVDLAEEIVHLVWKMVEWNLELTWLGRTILWILELLGIIEKESDDTGDSFEDLADETSNVTKEMDKMGRATDRLSKKIRDIPDRHFKITGDLQMPEIPKIEDQHFNIWGIYRGTEGRSYSLGGLVEASSYTIGGIVKQLLQSFQEGGEVLARLLPGEYIIPRDLVSLIKATREVPEGLVSAIASGRPPGAAVEKPAGGSSVVVKVNSYFYGDILTRVDEENLDEMSSIQAEKIKEKLAGVG